MFLREEEQRAERNLPPNKSPDKTEGYYAEKKCFKEKQRFFCNLQKRKVSGRQICGALLQTQRTLIQQNRFFSK